MANRGVPLNAAPAQRRSFARIVLVIALSVAIALWFALLRPAALDGTTSYVVVADDAMKPELDRQDLLLVRERDAYDVGDVVLVRVPDGQPGAGTRVVRRIVDGSDSAGYGLRRDDQPAPETWRSSADNVLGSQSVLLPRAGRVVDVVSSTVFLVSLGLVLFLLSARWALRPRRRVVAVPRHTEPTVAIASQVAATIRMRYFGEPDPAAKRALRHVAYEIAMTYSASSADFDKSKFLDACGISAEDTRGGPPDIRGGLTPAPRSQD